MPAELEALLAEQVAYYRARAAEYDATSLWNIEALRAPLSAALEAFGPRGEVLELACGTGQWTEQLAVNASRLAAVDASPETLAIAAARVRDERVRFIQSDIFAWQPEQRYDVVFFAAWLSHVPPQRFESFWALVERCLKPSGRVFFIDDLPVAAAEEQLIADAIAPAVQRLLNSGARYRTVKVFYEPTELQSQLAKLGWNIEINTVGRRLYYATANRSQTP